MEILDRGFGWEHLFRFRHIKFEMFVTQVDIVCNWIYKSEVKRQFWIKDKYLGAADM